MPRREEKSRFSTLCLSFASKMVRGKIKNSTLWSTQPLNVEQTEQTSFSLWKLKYLFCWCTFKCGQNGPTMWFHEKKKVTKKSCVKWDDFFTNTAGLLLLWIQWIQFFYSRKEKRKVVFKCELLPNYPSEVSYLAPFRSLIFWIYIASCPSTFVVN